MKRKIYALLKKSVLLKKMARFLFAKSFYVGLKTRNALARELLSHPSPAYHEQIPPDVKKIFISLKQR